MKKSTLSTILSLIASDTTPVAEEVRTEIMAEIDKGKAKADANRAVYAEMHDKIMEVLAGVSTPVSAQDIADETGFARGKIVYGLKNYWADEVKVVPGKVNTYTLA